MCFLQAYSVIGCRGGSGRGHPRPPLASKTSPALRGLMPAIPSFWASPGRTPTVGACGRCLVPATVAGIKLTYCASVRQQERSYFRQLLFCIGFQGCWCVSLLAYKSIILAVKTSQPQIIECWKLRVESGNFHHPHQPVSVQQIIPHKKSPQQGELLCLAVRTRLELATPCVTGTYSNQTELPDRLQYLKDLSLIASAKVRLFLIPTNFFSFFCTNNREKADNQQ